VCGLTVPNVPWVWVITHGLEPGWKISKKGDSIPKIDHTLPVWQFLYLLPFAKDGLQKEPKIMESQFSLSLFFFFPPHPTDFQHKITVQASPNLDKRRSLNSSSSSPPSSPTVIPRLRAIQRKLSPQNRGPWVEFCSWLTWIQLQQTCFYSSFLSMWCFVGVTTIWKAEVGLTFLSLVFTINDL